MAESKNAAAARRLGRLATDSEKIIERYLVRACAAIGVKALKYSNSNESGFPDRLLLLHGGSVVWVELKSKGRHPSALQKIRHEELRRMGHRVEVIDSKQGVDDLVNTLNHGHSL